MGHHVLDFIEGLKQPHFDSAILFGLIQFASMPGGPSAHGFGLKENADRESRLAIGSYIENEFAGRSLHSIGQRGALSHKVVLIDVTLTTGIGLQAAQSHWVLSLVVGLWSLAKRTKLNDQCPAYRPLLPGETTRPYSLARASRSNIR